MFAAAAAGVAFTMSVTAAGVAFAVRMVAVVMIAGEIRAKLQRTVQIAGHRAFDLAGNSGDQFDPLVGQRLLRTGADAAADQQIHAVV